MTENAGPENFSLGATALVGRQPIYGREVDVFAYELLFRNSEVNQASFVDGDMATAQVMLNAFMEIGIDNIVDQHLAFINLTRGFIVAGHCFALPKDRVVLEVLETVEVDEDVITALTRLSKEGYRIALDDFVYHESLQPLVDLADIIKIDVMELDRETIKEHVRILRQQPVKLLAEKVETHEDFEFCKELGFDHFQGYFFCKPKIIMVKRIPANRMATLTLLAQLQDPSLEISKLEGIIKQDLSLSYKVLRYVNSAFFALPKKMDSINQAVCMVGMERLKTWASLIILASMEDKPIALVVTAIVRGKMCEKLAVAHGKADPEQYFTVGLFSVLDGLFDRPMDDIVQSLPLSEEVHQALVKREGTLGSTLECVLAYERGDWDFVCGSGMNLEATRTSYLEAISWTSSMLPLLNG